MENNISPVWTLDKETPHSISEAADIVFTYAGNYTYCIIDEKRFEHNDLTGIAFQWTQLLRKAREIAQGHFFVPVITISYDNINGGIKFSLVDTGPIG